MSLLAILLAIYFGSIVGIFILNRVRLDGDDTIPFLVGLIPIINTLMVIMGVFDCLPDLFDRLCNSKSLARIDDWFRGR